MVPPLISTKLYIPKPRPGVIVRHRLKDRLNQGLYRKLTLISASAGYGKTTLISEWLSSCNRPVTWLSLDEGDNDLNRFLSYLIAALQSAAEHLENQQWNVSVLLGAPQSPKLASIISILINDLTKLAESLILVLDDFHVIQSSPVHNVISMLLEHMPPNLHMVILTREEPELQLNKMRVRDEVTEFSVQDLRFNHEESVLFLNNTMGLGLSLDVVSQLQERTEGWIAGLQIAALSMQGEQEGVSLLIPKNQRILLDYLINEVLLKQTEAIQKFLLYTSILDRFCGSLCNAVLLDEQNGDEILHALERTNLFIVSLDNEQHWYRYHHLFADLLRHQLKQHSIDNDQLEDVAVLHHRASVWYERNDLNLEAFRHAVAANDIEMATRLAIGNGFPLHLQGEVSPVLNWLESLSKAELDERPSLWVIFGSSLLMVGRPTEVEAKFLAAEAALPNTTTDAALNNLLGIVATTRAAVAAMTISSKYEAIDLKLQVIEDTLQTTNTADKTNELVGQIAAAHAEISLNRKQADIVIAQCNIALKLLVPELLPIRITAYWMLGVAHQLYENYSEAKAAYSEVLQLSRKMGGNIIEIMANVGLGNLKEAENQLVEAEAYYRRALFLNGDLPLPAICEAYLGLARICYVWDDFENAMEHVLKSVQLAQLVENKDIILSCEMMIATIHVSQQSWKEAAVVLAHAKKLAHSYRLSHRLPEIEQMQQLQEIQGMPNKQENLLQLPGHVPGEATAIIEPLTKRELEVLQLIALGYSNKEIGEKLFLALDTVKGHNRRIFEKLQVVRRTEAVVIARKLGWIE